MEDRLCRKDVQRILKCDRTTLYRREREGLQFKNGRITEGELAWFLELRDAARLLGMKVAKVIALHRDAQGDVVSAAAAARLTRLLRPRRRRSRPAATD